MVSLPVSMCSAPKPKDAQQSLYDAEFVRQQKLGQERRFRPNQSLVYKGNVMHSKVYDHVRQFWLRASEIFELFPKVGDYFRWFEFGSVIKPATIHKNIHGNLD